VASRTTIYLPDEVLAALEPVKERINVSAVCAVAIQHEVKRMQLMDAGATDREALLARLRLEKRASHAADEQAGRVDAARVVSRLDYDEFVAISHFSLDASYAKPGVYFRAMPEWAQEDIEQDPDFRPFDAEAWAYGWLAYVQDFWKSVKDDL
jgi:hypothetical protein